MAAHAHSLVHRTRDSDDVRGLSERPALCARSARTQPALCPARLLLSLATRTHPRCAPPRARTHPLPLLCVPHVCSCHRQHTHSHPAPPCARARARGSLFFCFVNCCGPRARPPATPASARTQTHTHTHRLQNTLAQRGPSRARSAVKAAIRDPNPVVFLETELMYGTTFPISDACEKDDFVLPLDKAKIMRTGTDVTIVTFSRMVGLALQVGLALDAYIYVYMCKIYV